MPATITLQELIGLDPTQNHVIDIRTPLEYASGHFKGAVNIPYDVLMMYPDSYLKQDKTYYLICAHGTLSHRASVILQSCGYNVANIKNGYDFRFRYY